MESNQTPEALKAIHEKAVALGKAHTHPEIVAEQISKLSPIGVRLVTVYLESLAVHIYEARLIAELVIEQRDSMLRDVLSKVDTAINMIEAGPNNMAEADKIYADLVNRVTGKA